MINRIERRNLLVVCGRNKRRSRTAEHIYKNDSRFNIRSAGISRQSDRILSKAGISWADLILVMDDEQKRYIKQMFSSQFLPPIEVLHIDDDYEFMDDELVEILRINIEALVKRFPKP